MVTTFQNLKRTWECWFWISHF